MSNQNDIAIIQGRFLADWDATIPLVLSFDALKELPKTMWARLDVRPGSETQITIFPVTYEVIGRIFFKVIVPKGARGRHARELIDKIGADWRGWHSPDYRIRCEDIDFRSGDDEDGSYMLLSIEYRSHQEAS